MATFTRIKTWVSNEVLTAADLNSEFNNILNNTSPTGIEDASSNVAAMQATTNPGGVGSESLATDLLGELKRLRYAVKRAVGGAQWYSAPQFDLTAGGILATHLTTDAVETAKIKDLNVTTAKLADGAVTKVKLGSLGQQLSSSSGAYTTTSTTYEDVTNLSCTITTYGRPVRIEVIPDGTVNPMELYVGEANDSPSMKWKIKRDSTAIAYCQVDGVGTSDANHVIQIPPPFFLDVVAAGTYTYTFQVLATSPAYIGFKYAKLLVYEV